LIVSDVINKLIESVPNFTGDITDNFNVNSMSASGSIVTVICDEPHGMKTGANAFLMGAQTPLSIASITRTVTLATLVTDDDHDLTFEDDLKINLSGSTEAEFNGEFDVVEVKNRKTIVFEVADSGPASATGSPVLLDGASYIQDYNGLHEVTGVPSPTSFTFARDAALPAPVGVAVVRTRPRVSGGVVPQELVNYYTSQSQGKAWLFAVLSSSRGSKDRMIEADSISNSPENTLFRQQVVQQMSVFAFFTVTNDINGVKASDQAQKIFVPICRSILRHRFDSLFAVGKQGTLAFTGHQVFFFDGSVYAHEFDFELTSDLTFDDTIGAPLSVAFRDIVPTYSPQVGGTDTLSGDVDLDEEPL